MIKIALKNKVDLDRLNRHFQSRGFENDKFLWIKNTSKLICEYPDSSLTCVIAVSRNQMKIVVFIGNISGASMFSYIEYSNKYKNIILDEELLVGEVCKFIKAKRNKIISVKRSAIMSPEFIAFAAGVIAITAIVIVEYLTKPTTYFALWLHGLF
jgi:hypothetical protein